MNIFSNCPTTKISPFAMLVRQSLQDTLKYNQKKYYTVLLIFHFAARLTKCTRRFTPGDDGKNEVCKCRHSFLVTIFILKMFRSLKTLPVKGKRGEVFRHPDIPTDVAEEKVNNNNKNNNNNNKKKKKNLAQQ